MTAALRGSPAHSILAGTRYCSGHLIQQRALLGNGMDSIWTLLEVLRSFSSSFYSVLLYPGCRNPVIG